MNIKKEKKIIGRKDRADFPDLDLYNINIKIDTGAYTGSIHCHNIQISERESEGYVQFNLLDPLDPEYDEKVYSLPLHKIKKVKNSFGETETRFFIKTKFLIFNETFEIQLSLTNRENMKFPILIGRKFLRNRFIVDATKVNLSYRQKKKLMKQSKRKL
ncbi:MAG: RimK/LysX family protein [Ignavibacteriaceae bacterium]